MATKEAVMQSATIEWAVDRLFYSYDEGFLESLGDAQAMTDRVMADLEEQWDELKAQFEQLYKEPVEAPCGWIFHRQGRPIGGPTWFLLDLWTGKRVEDANMPRYDLGVEAVLRLYIDRLPEARRLEAQERMHLMPYAAERFYPPYLDFSTNIYEESEPREFEVEFDPAYFAKRELPVPDLILVDVFIRLLNREDRDQDMLLTVELPEAIQRVNRSEKDGVVRDKYRITIPAYRAPSLPCQNSRHLEVRCQYPGISPALEELVKEEFFDRCDFPLGFYREAL